MANRQKRWQEEEARQAEEESLKALFTQHKNKSKNNKLSAIQRAALLKAEFDERRFPKELMNQKVRSVFYCYKALCNSVTTAMLENHYPSKVAFMAALIHKPRLWSKRGLIDFLFEYLHNMPLVRPLHTLNLPAGEDNTVLCWVIYEHCFVRYPHQLPYCLKWMFRKNVIECIGHPSPRVEQLVKLTEQMAKGKGLHAVLNLQFTYGFEIKISSKTHYYFQRHPVRFVGPDQAMIWALLRERGVSKPWANFLTAGYAYYIGFLLVKIKNIQLLFPVGASREEMERRGDMVLFAGRFLENIVHEEVEVKDQHLEEVMLYILPHFNELPEDRRSRLTNWLLKRKKEEGKQFRLKYRNVERLLNNYELVVLQEELEAMRQTDWRGAPYAGMAQEDLEIVELRSTAALRMEGLRMYHCVGSYTSSCQTGDISIWSVRRFHGDGKFDTLATLEVSDGRIEQVKGRFNMEPNAEVKALIRQWTEREGISWEQSVW